VAAFVVPVAQATTARSSAADPPCSPACVAHYKAHVRYQIHRRHILQRRRERRSQRYRWHRVADPYYGTFNAIARCESGGNWHINTGNGFYGGIQFTLQSWAAVGGRGLPSNASKLEQIYRGVLLMRIQGFGAWPVCRRAAGV